MIEILIVTTSQLTRTDDVLDLEVGELRVETKLLDNPSIFS